jgi:hypothetical protein
MIFSPSRLPVNFFEQIDTPPLRSPWGLRPLYPNGSAFRMRQASNMGISSHGRLNAR